jgi:hypothetical protein
LRLKPKLLNTTSASAEQALPSTRQVHRPLLAGQSLIDS